LKSSLDETERSLVSLLENYLANATHWVYVFVQDQIFVIRHYN
jgi:hypothetical protein